MAAERDRKRAQARHAPGCVRDSEVEVCGGITPSRSLDRPPPPIGEWVREQRFRISYANGQAPLPHHIVVNGAERWWPISMNIRVELRPPGVPACGLEILTLSELFHASPRG